MIKKWYGPLSTSTLPALSNSWQHISALPTYSLSSDHSSVYISSHISLLCPRKDALSSENVGHTALFPPANDGYPPPLPNGPTIYGGARFSSSCGFPYPDALSGIFHIDRIDFCTPGSLFCRSGFVLGTDHDIQIFIINIFIPFMKSFFGLETFVRQRRHPPTIHHLQIHSVLYPASMVTILISGNRSVTLS